MIKKISIVSLVLILLLSLHLITNYSKNDNNKINKDNNRFAIMLESGVGTDNYEKSTSNTWPSSGYTYNSERSYCENGSTLEWDNSNDTINIDTRYADKCYVYFDKQ